MAELTLGFIIAVFIAGLITFLAPCTLPLLPAYLAFISGIQTKNGTSIDSDKQNRNTLVKNGTAFVLGFSLIFISFGMLAGFIGGELAMFRDVLTRVGGALIILFGLFMLGIIEVGVLSREYRITLPATLTPGHPTSAFLIGATFALGWTPCIGPILATVLFLASSEATVASGGILLVVFSAGLAIPFLALAFFFERFSKHLPKWSHFSIWIARVGGVFLIGIGLLLLFDAFGLTIVYGYKLFEFINYETILEYL